MGIKHYKPTSPGVRAKTVLTSDDVSKKKPEKSLTRPLKKSGGRNNQGRTTVWCRGGGHKRKLRIIDYRRDKFDIPARVAAIEYDPNRSARIALLFYADGEKRYIIAPLGLSVGDSVISSQNADIKPANCLPLKHIPVGTLVHNVELKIGKGGQIARGAGAVCQILAKEGKNAHVKLPSGEVRLINLNCRATIGQVGNLEYENVSIGKAGRKRWLGKRPNVRGTAMNPVDHPHGGGEGKAKGGRHPVSPWGMPTKGYKTRPKKPSDNFIVKRRK